MMNIGEFGRITGLSVKALRHYDETGVLRPAGTDDRSGYRQYNEGQVRAGVVVGALRGAGVPLAEVDVALGRAGGGAVLTAYRERVLADRAREDKAFAAAVGELRALAVPVTVVERRRDEQPFVGRVLDPGADEDTADAAFGAFLEQLQAAEAGPGGPFWSALRPGPDDMGELLLCWPTSVELEAGWGGPDTVVGVLPARTELAAAWCPSGGEQLGEGMVNPAVVALLDALHERGATVAGTELRQTSCGGATGGIEVSLTTEHDGWR